MYSRMDAILLGVHIGSFFSVYLYSNVINIFIAQVMISEIGLLILAWFLCL